MLFRFLKIGFFIGILLSSLTIILTKFLRPSRELLILIFYIIILSSVASSLAIYYEFYLKPERQRKKIKKIFEDLSNIKINLKEKYDLYDNLLLNERQTLHMLEIGLEKIEEKIEKIEKEVMDKSKY
ncbi:MAG: hypothetical protein QXZ43_01800 [Candidatus Aenigmatarchaeota archaeon]